MNGVRTEAGHNANRRSSRGAQNPNVVVALRHVDDEFLDIDKLHEESGTIDTVPRDDDRVLELGGDDDDTVEAATAVDRHRRIERVGDLVNAATSRHVGRTAQLIEHLFPVDRLSEGKCPDDKDIITVTTVEIQHRAVVINREQIATRSAVQDQLVGDTHAQPSACGLDHDTVINAIADEIVTEDLTNLEDVTFVGTVDDRDRAIVVECEVVRSTHGINGQRAVDVGVVVDPLKGGQLGAVAVILEQSDKLPAEEHGVVGRGLVNDEIIHASDTRVVHVDHGVPLPAQADDEEVATFVAVQGEFGADRIAGGHMRRVD